MSGPSRPSATGGTTTPFSPISKHINDDLTSVQFTPEDDNDDLYTCSAPLLSDHTRRNSTSSLAYSTWSSTRSPNAQTARYIFIFSLAAVILVAQFGTSLSTGLLSIRILHLRKDLYDCRATGNHKEHWTRIPSTQSPTSSNFRLDFPALYPPLSESSSETCRSAWSALKRIPCHEKILNRSWDYGKRASLFDPDVGLYAWGMCQGECQRDVERAWGTISLKCNEDDRWDMSRYNGPFLRDPGFEAGPRGVMETVARRVAHTCRKEDVNSFGPFCPTVLWEDWGIVDGMYAGNLEGLERFLQTTKVKRTEGGRLSEAHLVRDFADDVTWQDHRNVAERRLGPGKNETDCGVCVLDWLERKAGAWEEGVRDPRTGEKVGFKKYVGWVRAAGQRCEGWDGAWRRVVEKYGVRGMKGLESFEWVEESGGEEDDDVLKIVITEGYGFDDEEK